MSRRGIVPRVRLIKLLEEEAGSFAVVLLSAGAGWGKTTLLAQWASQSRRPFAWVSADTSDNDPIVLLTDVATALDQVLPLDPAVFEALESPAVSVEETVVPRLGAALATMDEALVLVLDDLQLVDSPPCLDAIAALARHVPKGSQLALSTRRLAALPVAAWRTNGLAFEIGPNELRMDDADARQLLSAAGRDPTDDQVADLTEQTEGWAAGLYLAARSMRGRGVKANGAPLVSGSGRLVSDYLRTELLAHLSAADLQFLTRTAVLERMSGPLCDAVLGSSASAAKLGAFERSNLFLVPLDRRRHWYRYHSLFRELLRSELVRGERELVPVLLARASEWSEANGEPEAAIGYAQQAGDSDRVARLVEHHSQAVYQSGGAATLESWLDWLDAHGALEQNAAVAVLGALVAAGQGRPAEAHRWADLAGRASYDGTLCDGSASFESWLALLSAAQCRRGLARMRADAQAAVRTLAPGSPLRPIALLLHGTSEWLAGEVDHADDLLADAAEEGLARGTTEPAALALAERAMIAIAREAWVEAEEAAACAARVIRRSGIEEYPVSASVHAVAARIALHSGDTAGAQELLSMAQRLRPRLTYALPYLSLLVRLELARAYLTLADAGGAATMLHEIETVLRRQPDLGTLAAQAEELRSILKTMRASAPGASTLTEAELRLVPYLSTHLSFREIGERLYLSRHTVKSHAMAVYRKLNVSSRSAAVERAREFGLI